MVEGLFFGLEKKIIRIFIWVYNGKLVYRVIRFVKYWYEKIFILFINYFIWVVFSISIIKIN